MVKIDLRRLRPRVAERPEATTKELHARLSVDRGLSAVDLAPRRAERTIKKCCGPRSRIAPTSRRNAPTASSSSPNLLPVDGSSSTKPGARPT